MSSSVSSSPTSFSPREVQELRRALLAWYDREARILPWRIHGHAGGSAGGSGRRMSAYRVLLSETMLQQTQVSVVVERYREFVRRWPSARALASASLDEVLAAWSGLGYYSRARNLHRAVGEVVAHRGGHFPRDVEALRRLPGVGPYTANAVAALAFGHAVVAIDGNVRRVGARLFAYDAKPRLLEGAIQGLAGQTPAGMDAAARARHGDFAQALMELGALVCRPRAPRCGLCPLSGYCVAYRRGQVDSFPQRVARARRAVREGRAWIVERDGAYLLLARAPRGLLGGMFLPPLEGLDNPRVKTNTEMRALQTALAAHSTTRGFVEVGEVRHVFTHISFTARVYHLRLKPVKSDAERALLLWLSRALAPLEESGTAVWLPYDALGEIALPSLTSKLIVASRHRLKGVALVEAARRKD
ncbi:MAG: A/G-specific adenine glycosylase [Alphaproteobacteria bacterium]